MQDFSINNTRNNFQKNWATWEVILNHKCAAWFDKDMSGEIKDKGHGHKLDLSESAAK